MPPFFLRNGGFFRFLEKIIKIAILFLFFQKQFISLQLKYLKDN